MLPSGESTGNVSSPAASVTAVNCCHTGSRVIVRLASHQPDTPARIAVSRTIGANRSAPPRAGAARDSSAAIAPDRVDTPETVSRAKARSCAEWNLRSGFFSRHRLMMRSNAGGIAAPPFSVSGNRH